MPAEPAPGQAAYEVMYRASGVDVRWEGLDGDDQRLWENIAAAAWAPERDRLSAALAEIASLRGQLDRLGIADVEFRGDLDDLASHWEHSDHPDGLTRDETWEQEGRRGCARELREALQGGGDGD